MDIELPEQSLVFLFGPSSHEKTAFTARHFFPGEVVSTGALRQWISNDESDLSTSSDAFDLLLHIVALRLKRGLLTVVDAADLPAESRRSLLRLAHDHYIQPAAIVFGTPAASPQVARSPERTLTRLKNEGIPRAYIVEPIGQASDTNMRRLPMSVDYRRLSGPFDIIGDVHGCTEEVEELLARLGYTKISIKNPAPWSTYPHRYTHPAGRTLVFVGDIVDRGPRILDAWQIVFHSCAAGEVLVVPGNHDDKLLRWLNSNNVEIAHGLENSVAEIEALPPEIRPAFQAAMRSFFDNLPSHLVLDGGRLVVAHAGVKARMIGRDTRRVRDFALYGETHGEIDELGLPIRYNWAADYNGDAMIVYGHTPVANPEWQNRTLNIDTGCVYGGRLTALRYPELDLVSVPARRTYHAPKKKR